MRTTTSILVLCALAQPALAQEDNQLSLARICVSEGSFDIDEHECAALYAVIRNRSTQHNIPISSIMRGYSSRTFDLQRTDQRAYIAHLQRDGRAPAGWPRYGRSRRIQLADGTAAIRLMSAPPWRQYRARWLRLLATVRDIFAGRITHACVEEPLDWGGDMDTHGYRSRNLFATIIDCGETHNTFWRPTIQQSDFSELIRELARRDEPATIEGDVQPRPTSAPSPRRSDT